jgi:sulfopyruvate decarboxylase TPP-binding subunit
MARAQLVVEELKKCGITHVAWLPDSESIYMYEALIATPELSLIPVCREGETFAIAAGLYLGGKNPAVLIQNTGLLESGDALRGTVLALEIPLLLMVGYRGYHGLVAGKKPPDTAAVYTEPILKAWGLHHYLVDTDQDVGKIALAYKEAQETSKPVVVLIGREYV